MNIFDAPIYEEEKKPSLFTEAVFHGDKEGMTSIINAFKKVQDTYEEFKKENLGKINFKYDKFYHDQSWKDLEDAVQKKFNFRSVVIYHVYPFKVGSGAMRAYTYNENRYPIEGLVTDKGLWDNTKSLNLVVQFETAILDKLSPEELTAILLHSIAHNIDPAVMNINFVGMQKYIEYLGKRSLTKEKVKTEIQKYFREIENSVKGGFTFGVILGTLWYASTRTLTVSFGIGFFIVRILRTLFFNPNQALTVLKQRLKEEKNLINTYDNTEAFADNFARMYGMGHHLISAYDKLYKLRMQPNKNWLFLKYKARDVAIIELCIASLKDVNKTNAHRLYNMLKEYDKDLADESIPDGVKKGIREDRQRLQDIVDVYNNDKTDFANRVSAFIIEYLRDKDLGELRVKERK